MAETVAIKIEVDAGKSIKTLGDIEKEISGINHEMNELSEINQEFKQELIELERRFAKIPKTALQARKVVGDQLEDLKAAIKDNNVALQNFRLKKKQLNDIKRDIKDMGNEFIESSETILGFGASLGEATAGFMLLTGASEENTEKLEKAIGVALAFEGTAQSISGAIKIWNEQLRNSAIVQKLVTAGQWLYTTAVGASSGALKLFRLALISTGIGAIVILIVSLIANFDKVWGWIKKVTSVFAPFGKAIGKVINTVLKPFKWIIDQIIDALQFLGLVESDQEKASRLRATRKEKAIRKELEAIQDLLDKTKELRDETLKQAKDALQIFKNNVKSSDKRIKMAEAEGKSQKEILKLQEDEIIKLRAIAVAKRDKAKIALQELEKERKELIKLNDQWDKLTEKEKKSLNERRDIWSKNVTEQKKIQSDFNNFIDESYERIELADVKASTKRREERKKEAEERKEKEIERLEREKQAIFDLQIAQKEADAEDILDEKKKAEALINIERFKNEKELEDKKLTDAEKELLEFEYQQRIADISQEFVDAELEREQAEAERLAEVQKENEEKDKEARDKKLEADKELADKRIELEQQIQDESFNLALGGIDALLQLNDAFAGQTEAQQKKSFERNKKLQIAQALIGASQGVVNILANASTIPDPFGTIYKVGQLAILAGVTYINGEVKGTGSVVNIASSITADESVATYLVDTSSGNIVITLPTDINIGKIWNVKLIDETNTCQLRCVGRLIDGNVTVTITQINTCLSVQYDGNDYKII